MHPVIARKLVEERHDELIRGTASTRHGPRRHIFPRWHVSWTRTVLDPVTAAGTPAQTGRGRPHRGSSLVIIISAHRSA
jgi:hypothetical protein